MSESLNKPTGKFTSIRLEIVLVLAASLLFSICLWYLKQPAHLLQLRSDQHNIASFAAAQEHPERYANDILLSDPVNYKWYTPLYVAAIKYITRLTGSYAATFVALIIPTVTLFLSGTYFLLRYLTQNRVLSAGLALIFTVALIRIPLAADWNIIEVAHMRPNNQFIALLPWSLLLAVWSRNHAMFWPLVGVCSAALLYVHPVSAPAWGFAVFGGLLWASKEYYDIRTRIIWLLLLAIAAVLIVAPYFIIFARTYPGKQPPPDQYETIYNFAAQRLIPGSLDLGLLLKNLFNYARRRDTRFFTLFLLTWAITGQIFAWKGDRKTRTIARFLILGLVFYMLITVGIPLTDQIISTRLRRMPFEIDLARGLKFWPWWLLLLGAPGFQGLQKSVLASKKCPVHTARSLTIIIVCIALLVSHSITTRNIRRYLRVTKANPEFAKKMEATDELVSFIEQNTPTNATFFGKCWPIWLRHTPGRGVFLTWKDSGALLCVNYNGLKKFIDLWNQQEQANTIDQIYTFCKRCGVDYLLLQSPDNPAVDNYRILFSNSMWKIVQINPTE
jgi:hypothetical protein